MMQTTFFDFSNRREDLLQMQPAQTLVRLNQFIDWEIFREQLLTVRNKERKNASGRKPYDVVLMFKILILQSLYNLSDAQIEFQIRDRITFMNFLGLGLQDRVPDEKTVWLFREQLTKAELIKPLFDRFEDLLVAEGFEAKRGQMVDATIVNVPIQRNSKEENEQIKAGETPEEWSESKQRQKDTDARFTKKRNKSYYGYKNHANVDVEHKIIRDYDVTAASVHDSQVFEDLLQPPGEHPDVYADSAYRSKQTEEDLATSSYRSQVHERPYRNKPLTEDQKSANQQRSKIRVRVEHVFGSQLQLAGTAVIRSIGLGRAKTQLGLRNLGYNLNRFGFLKSAQSIN
jgi:IS5 family transposase